MSAESFAKTIAGLVIVFLLFQGQMSSFRGYEHFLRERVYR